MTIKEAKEVLQEQIDKYGQEYDDEGIEALEIAIKILEQESSEDEEVIRVTKGTVKARKDRFVIYDAEWLKEHFNTTEAKLYGKPSEDCISRQAVEEITWEEPSYTDALNVLTEIRYKVRALPSVTSQPKKGHWIDKRCSICGCHSILGLCVENYCANCGAKMEVEK